MNSVDFYNANSDRFVESTVHLDLCFLYNPFLKLVPPNGHILDAGCGSGRDALYFLQQGYRVSAFDASEEMVKHASRLTGLPVRHLRFEELEIHEEFDAIWANASLLHVPRASMDDVVERLANALKTQGILYASFKYGENEQVRNDRWFNDYTEDRFLALAERHPRLKIASLWVSQDTRPGLESQKWLNAILRKG